MKCILVLALIGYSMASSAQKNDTWPISIESLKHSVTALANDSMKGRFTGKEGAWMAANFIAERFKEAGLSKIKGLENYFQHFDFGNNNYYRYSSSGINVIGALKGKVSPDTFVIFSAHYDHIGITPGLQKDSIFNGANDNASGTAALIELARYYVEKRDNYYTILFVGFAAEELGLIGSKFFVSTIDQSKVRAVINMDMVGRSVRKDCLLVGYNARNIIKAFNKKTGGKSFFSPDRYASESLISRSDHASFENSKNAFLLICTPPNDRYYHQVGDEAQTIDFDFLQKFCKKVAIASEIFTQPGFL